MLIEMVENKPDEIRIVPTPWGGKILSNCFVCLSPIKAGDQYIAICNRCGAEMTEEQRSAAYRAACKRYPGI